METTDKNGQIVKVGDRVSFFPGFQDRWLIGRVIDIILKDETPVLIITTRRNAKKHWNRLGEHVDKTCVHHTVIDNFNV